MATKKKQVELAVPPKLCASIIIQAFKNVGVYNSYDPDKKVFRGSYKYFYQKVPISIILRADNKGKSLIQIVGKTDDLIGTGANIAIKKLVESLNKSEEKYSVDLIIEKGFKHALAQEYNEARTIFSQIQAKRPNDFKVLLGLGLCYFDENNIDKATEYINTAITCSEDEKTQLIQSRKVVKSLFTIKAFDLATDIFTAIGTNPNALEKDKRFYLLLLLQSKNFEQLSQIIAQEFPMSKINFQKLTKDRSASHDLLKEFEEKSDFLVKTIRNKIVFNIMPQSIAYLLSIKSYSLPEEYRDLIRKFYRDKKLKISPLIECYDKLIDLINKTDNKAKTHLLSTSKDDILEISNKAQLLNIISESKIDVLNNSEFTEMATEIQGFGIKLSTSKRFKEYQSVVNTSPKILESVNKYFDDLKIKFQSYVNQMLDRHDTRASQKLITLFEQIYGHEIENKHVFDEKIQNINSKKSKRLKKVFAISFLVISIILVSIYFIPKENNPSETLSPNIQEVESLNNLNEEIESNTNKNVIKRDAPKKVVSLREKIEQFYYHAHQKDLTSLMAFYSFPITYYSRKNVSYEEVKNIYLKSWNRKIYSKNTILDLFKINDFECTVKVRYIWQNKDGTGGEVESQINFKFNEDYKLISQTPIKN